MQYCFTTAFLCLACGIFAKTLAMPAFYPSSYPHHLHSSNYSMPMRTRYIPVDNTKELTAQCPEPPYIDHGHWTAVNVGGDSWAPSFRGRGAILKMQCDRCYGLAGESPTSTITCLPWHFWSVETTFCKEIVCETDILPYVMNGYIEDSGPNYCLGKRPINCNPGYVILGPDSVICQGDGTWSTPGMCISEGLYQRFLGRNQ